MRPELRYLSNKDLEYVHNLALELLEDMGIELCAEEARDYFRQAGGCRPIPGYRPSRTPA